MNAAQRDVFIKYYNFTKSKGRPLSEINPGSDEYALEVSDALEAVELLDGSQQPVLGGEIMSEDKGVLAYAMHSWGKDLDYYYLNWHCDKKEDEDQAELCDRSYKMAKESILKASEVAKQLDKKCYIVLTA